MSQCPICRRDLEQPATGRPRRFCSHACRQLAYRRRHQTEPAWQQASAEATALLNEVFRHSLRRRG